MSRDRSGNRTQEVIGSIPFSSTTFAARFDLFSTPENRHRGNSTASARRPQPKR
jgi:hypothetical protein